MTSMQSVDTAPPAATGDRALADLQQQVLNLTQQLDSMRGNVTGRQLLDRGALVVDIGTIRTDTVGVRHGTANFYVAGATIVMQVFNFDAQAWRAVAFT